MVGGGALAPRPGDLPVHLTRWFGRDGQVTEVLAAVRGSRLVTLVGAPGCGKTRLAVEVGAQLADELPAGVRFVELAPVVDPTMIATVVGACLGIREQPRRPMTETLVEALAHTEPVLLVIDNCEHLLDGVSALVRDLVAGGPALRILATSRAALRLSGERVWTVPPLDAGPARDLFVDRARLASSRFRIEPSDERLVAEVCHRLDGLPLAIELVSAWSRIFSLSQIAGQLEDALPSLPSRVRDNVPRHETMAASIGWSHDLLDPPVQALFAQLSVFAGGFDLHAARAVADASLDVLLGLTMLVDQSLVETTSLGTAPMRYRMLEPVRQCAAGLLAASRAADVHRRRHAEHYLMIAEGFDPAGVRGVTPSLPLPLSLHRVQQEQGNLFVALEWARRQPTDLCLRLCSAMHFLWTHGGRVNDGRAWYATALAAGTADPGLRADALWGAGALARRQGDYDTAAQLLDEGLRLATETGDPRRRGRLLVQLGNVAWQRGQGPEAVRLCEDGIALIQTSGTEEGLTYALVPLAWSHYIAGEIAAGDDRARQALARAEAAANSTLVAQAHHALCFGSLLAGNTAAQRAHLTATLAAMDDGGFVEESDWLGSAAALAAAEGRLHTGVKLAGAAYAFGRRHGSQPPELVIEAMTPPHMRDYQAIGPDVAERLIEQGARMSWEELTALALEPPPAGEEKSLLTPREQEIAGLVGQGLSNADIARQLFISRRTVESHLDHIRQKLGLRHRHHVIAWWMGGRGDTSPV